ncbi:MAG TPA: hypothetical protein VIV12_30115 [Streptosporangiaceae bacterium]
MRYIWSTDRLRLIPWPNGITAAEARAYEWSRPVGLDDLIKTEKAKRLMDIMNEGVRP